MKAHKGERVRACIKLYGSNTLWTPWYETRRDVREYLRRQKLLDDIEQFKYEYRTSRWKWCPSLFCWVEAGE